MQFGQKLRVSGIPQLAGSPYRLVQQLSCVDFAEHLPTENTRLLLSGEVDAALIPSVDLAATSGLRSLEFGMGCRSRSDSMVLYAKQPIEQLHTIFIYSCSQSSLALLRLLLAERWKTNPTIIRQSTLEPLEHVERGCGVLGLHALPGMQHHEYSVCEDLAHVWHEHTGLPFVFLVWALRKDYPLTEAVIRFQKWLHRSAHASRGIACELADEYGTTRRDASVFIGDNRRYYIDEFLLRGLGEFLYRASNRGLIEQVRYRPLCRPIEATLEKFSGHPMTVSS